MTPSLAIAELHRFTTADLILMVELGALAEGSGLELLDGHLLDRSPEGPEHAHTRLKVAQHLFLAVREFTRVLQEIGVAIDDHNLPVLDVVFLRTPLTATALPTGTDCELIVEVTCTTHRADAMKATLYAAGGVPVYWSLDLSARELVVYEQPDKAGYRVMRRLSESEIVQIPSTSVTLPVASLLP